MHIKQLIKHISIYQFNFPDKIKKCDIAGTCTFCIQNYVF